MRLYKGEQEGHQSITSETGEGSFYCTAGGCIPVGACTFGAEKLTVSSGLCPSVPGLCLHCSGGVRQLIGFCLHESFSLHGRRLQMWNSGQSIALLLHQLRPAFSLRRR